MPQMMPLYWITMIMATTILLSCMISFSFFFYLPALPKTHSHKTASLKLNWPWLW